MERGYWREVSGRAFWAAAKTARIESGEAVVMLIVSQSVLAVLLWYLSGDANIWVRIGTAALPFLLLAPLYVWKFWTIPPQMAVEASAEHAADISRLQSKLDTLNADKAALQNKIAALGAPPPPPSRDPDGIYQHGVKVGTVVRPEVDLSRSAAHFVEVRSGDTFNGSADFEYRDFVLRIEKTGAATKAIVAGQVNRAFHDVLCHVVGRR